MLFDLPSLRGFQPHFFAGGPERFHLPFAYDLVAIGKPKNVIALGFGEGELYFAFCQAARENPPAGRFLAVCDAKAGEPGNDNAWQASLQHNREFYGDFSMMVEASPGEAAADFADGSVDLLLLNDCDSYAAAHRRFGPWTAKISPAGIILIHGIGLKREESIDRFWREMRTEASVEFSAGLGLGVNRQIIGAATDHAEVEQLYHLLADQIETKARAAHAAGESRLLQLRQIWLPTLLDDRIQMQDTIDHLNRHIAHITRVHEWNEGQLKARVDALTANLAAKNIPPRELVKGRRNEAQPEPRSVARRIIRELLRIPRNLRRLWSGPPSKKKENRPLPLLATPVAGEPPSKVINRYELWITDHEPDEVALEEYRRSASVRKNPPAISLLVPVHNTPARFLDEMFASILQQTYPFWQLCVVDAGSDRAETIEALNRSKDPRVRFERLERNRGISDNSNRALAMATGEFVALLDHDDLLAPFALHELAQGIASFPGAEIFYSDEDRIDERGRRHSPFFKPQWSPELLYSCMYLGHLTAYRRELLQKLGGFRKEFDLSQDYDLALRATEVAREIRHIPRVLYHWREHAASGSIGGKPEARKTNLAALDDAMRRRNLPAEVVEYSTANRARLTLSRWPKVSVIIPSDSAERAEYCAVQLPSATSYAEFEIIIVTNSRVGDELASNAEKSRSVRVVRYDKPFNFSDKCNAGAQAAIGERLVFLNDDVEPQQRDWIEGLIEPLENPEVGAVGPKLIYLTETIQHAGLVTGVRGFVGTAFHQLPKDSTVYVNFAQSMRNVSAVSGAALALRREDFFRIGGFDAEHVPVLHSDVELCFKLRAEGLRCIYTPFVVMTHLGHASLGGSEPAARAKDKSVIYLLKRWAGYMTHDPYFPDNMRDWLYTDSPAPIRMFGRNSSEPIETKRDLLFVSPDLERDYAGFDFAHIFTIVLARQDGPMQKEYEAAGIPVIIDPLAFRDEATFAAFCRNFDRLVATAPGCETLVRIARAAGVAIGPEPPQETSATALGQTVGTN